MSINKLLNKIIAQAVCEDNGQLVVECMNAKAEIKKYPLEYSNGVGLHCGVCGSGEYITNEDGNDNDYCGQCGNKIDHDRVINTDVED